MKKIVLSLVAFVFSTGAWAQSVFTLDSCRAMAVENNKDMRMASIDREIAELNKKAAFTKYLPRITATGAYVYTSKDIHLISDEQEEALRGFGDKISTTAGGMLQQFQQQSQALLTNPQIQQMLATNPQLAGMVQQLMPQIQGAMQGAPGAIQQISGAVNGAGNNLADALQLNTNNIFTAGVMLTQPIYMGGKIMAYNKITDLMAQADEQKHSIKNQELLVQVDQAYWQIVDLQSKKKLAQGYLDLLKTLENNVDKLADNGFATKADALSVKVKRNEAEVTVIQVDNGLSLSRMLLCQICGLPLNTEFTLFDENNDIVDFIDVESEIADTANTVDISNVKRPEISALDLAAEIYRQKVNVVRSEYLPNVVLMGGYVATSPSAFNGFENKFKGMWTVGVGVKVPIVTSGERIYKVKAAKLEADKAACKLDETREKISLQVNQCAQRLDEARRRLVTAKSSLAAADENLRYANVGLKEGMIPVSTVLQAQTAWLQAQSTMVQAQIDVKLAKVNLQKALGQLE